MVQGRTHAMDVFSEKFIVLLYLSIAQVVRLELVHTDVLGPVEIPSVGGTRYLITFIDDFSHWIVEHTMKATATPTNTPTPTSSTTPSPSMTA